MAAPKGNQFWKQRSKHGRDKIFSSPDILWAEACEYFDWCDTNPIVKTETTVSERGSQFKSIEYKVPYTWDGLEFFLGLSSLRKYKTQDSHKDFIQVITHIEKVIYSQKFSGAAAGVFNANIIARDLGLADKKEVEGGLKIETITGMNIT